MKVRVQIGFVLLGLLMWEPVVGGLRAQGPEDQKAADLIRSAERSEMLGYILAGVGVLIVAAVLPVAIVLGRKKRARKDADDANSRGKRTRPYWVNLALWGLPTRAWARAFFWLAIGAAVLCIVLGFMEPILFVGATIVVAAIWSHAAIRWVDQHGRWS